MAGHPVAVAAEALVQWLGTQGISKVLRGWPEREEDLDFSSGAVVSVTQAGDPTYTWGTPYPVEEAAQGDDLLVTWLLGDLMVEFQLDVWAPFRAVRDEAAAVVDAAMHADLPYVTGLELALDNYYGQLLAVIPLSSTALDDADAVTTREWRQRILVRCDLGIVAQGTTPKQAQLTLGLTTTVQGADVVELDHEYDFEE